MTEKNKKPWLGILSIILGVLIPAVGVGVGIIGLTLKKQRNDINYIGIVVSIISWIMYFSML